MYAHGWVTLCMPKVTLLLETVVVAALQDAGYSLALVETNTGGEVARRLQAVPGADQIIRRSQVVSSPVEIGSGGPANLVSSGAAEWAARQLLSDAQEDGATLGFALCGTMDPAAGPYGVYRGETFVGHSNRRQRVEHAHRYRRHGRTGPPLGWKRCP